MDDTIGDAVGRKGRFHTFVPIRVIRFETLDVDDREKFDPTGQTISGVIPSEEDCELVVSIQVLDNNEDKSIGMRIIDDVEL